MKTCPGTYRGSDGPRPCGCDLQKRAEWTPGVHDIQCPMCKCALRVTVEKRPTVVDVRLAEEDE